MRAVRIQPFSGTGAAREITQAVQDQLVPFFNIRDVRECNELLDGSADYVSAGNISSGANGTMEAWIKPANTTYITNWIYVMGGSSDGNDPNVTYDLFVKNTDCPIIGLGHSNWEWNSFTKQFVPVKIYNDTNFPIGVWKHLAVTYNGSNVSFYTDGVLINVTTQTVSRSR